MSCCTAGITKEGLQEIVFGNLRWTNFEELLATNALTFHQNRLAVMIEEDHGVIFLTHGAAASLLQ